MAWQKCSCKIRKKEASSKVKNAIRNVIFSLLQQKLNACPVQRFVKFYMKKYHETNSCAHQFYLYFRTKKPVWIITWLEVLDGLKWNLLMATTGNVVKTANINFNRFWMSRQKLSIILLFYIADPFIAKRWYESCMKL